MTDASINLLAKFIVRHSSSADLKTVLVVQHWEDLLAKFVVRRTVLFPPQLKAKFNVVRTWAELKAKFMIRHNSILNLLSKFVVRHAGLEDLAAIFNIRHSTYATIPAEFTVRHSSSLDLHAEFFIEHAADLLATFKVVRRYGSIIPIYAGNLAEWINYVEGLGSGFVMNPEIANDPIQKLFEFPSLKINSIITPHRFDSVRFGYVASPLGTYRVAHAGFNQLKASFYTYPDISCVGEKDYELLVSEDWDWSEKSYITSIAADTHIRLQFARHFGNSGWTLGNINYGTVDYLKVSYFDYVFPGDCYNRWRNLDDEETFIQFNIGTPSLTRLGYARYEMFRYYGTDCRQRLSLRRIASCEEVPETYIYWNPANIIGGCSHPPLNLNTWSELQLRWDISGRENLTMGGGPYMGLSAFVQSTPIIYYGLTAETGEWDMIEITRILQGWVNSEFKNNGIGIRGEQTSEVYTGWDYRCSNRVNASTPRFYSRRSSDPRKPMIMLQYIPVSSVGRWIFQKRDSPANGIPLIGTSWEIVAGHTGLALRLRDWSKHNYQLTRQHRPGLEFSTSEVLAEGKIETWLNLPQDSWPRLWAQNQDECKVCQIVYTTPNNNSIDFYFRWIDRNNYYVISIHPQSRSSSLTRRLNGTNSVLATWTTPLSIGDWKWCRFFWSLNNEGKLVICGQMRDPYLPWTTFFSYTHSNPSFNTGGKIRVESWDAILDDTKILEEL